MTSPINPQSTELLKKNFIWVVIMVLSYCVLMLYQDQKELYEKMNTINEGIIKKNTEAIIKNTEMLERLLLKPKTTEDEED